MLFNTVDAL
jgi:hypothetical protein